MFVIKPYFTFTGKLQVVHAPCNPCAWGCIIACCINTPTVHSRRSWTQEAGPIPPNFAHPPLGFAHFRVIALHNRSLQPHTAPTSPARAPTLTALSPVVGNSCNDLECGGQEAHKSRK